MTIFINPGAEALSPGSPEQALSNLTVFIADLKSIEGILASNPRINPEADNDDGRWGFLIDVDGLPIDVDMPGWPLDEVRYLDTADQNIWDFPRLYVCGSSWVWNYALGAVRQHVEDANG